MANMITDVTRQEIIDLFAMGFRDPDSDEETFYHWSGRQNEPEFLSRIFDLKKLPSRDYRYRDAFSDIYQHCVNNSDWEDDWVFYDNRFNLKSGSDQLFLQFLCEVFHPAVRNERGKWKTLLELINQLLRRDGFELFEETSISGRSKYSSRKIESKNLVRETQTATLAQKFDSDYIQAQIETMNKSIDEKPYEAIGKAKELFENCCLTILEERQQPIEHDWDVTRLTKETCRVLKLTPDNIESAEKASETIKKLLGNLAAISQSIAELRNAYGSGHGKGASFRSLTSKHARLAVGTAVTAVLFLWESHEEQI